MNKKNEISSTLTSISHGAIKAISLVYDWVFFFFICFGLLLKFNHSSLGRIAKLVILGKLQIHDIEFADNLDDVIGEALPAVEEIVKQGKARYIGVTGYPLATLKEAISRAPGRFQVNQLHRYSIFFYISFRFFFFSDCPLVRATHVA